MALKVFILYQSWIQPPPYCGVAQAYICFSFLSYIFFLAFFHSFYNNHDCRFIHGPQSPEYLQWSGSAKYLWTFVIFFQKFMVLFSCAPCPVKALNSLLSSIITRFVPSKIKSRSHDKPCFNKWCHQAYKEKHTAYNLWIAHRTCPCWECYVAIWNIATNVYRPSRLI